MTSSSTPPETETMDKTLKKKRSTLTKDKAQKAGTTTTGSLDDFFDMSSSTAMTKRPRPTTGKKSGKQLKRKVVSSLSESTAESTAPASAPLPLPKVETTADEDSDLILVTSVEGPVPLCKETSNQKEQETCKKDTDIPLDGAITPPPACFAPKTDMLLKLSYVLPCPAYMGSFV